LSKKKKNEIMFPMRLKDEESFTVPDGKKARILVGVVRHVTGAASVLGVGFPEGLDNTMSRPTLHRVEAATGSSAFTLNENVQTNVTMQVDTDDFWLPERCSYTFIGDTAAYVTFVIELRNLEG